MFHIDVSSAANGPAVILAPTSAQRKTPKETKQAIDESGLFTDPVKIVSSEEAAKIEKDRATFLEVSMADAAEEKPAREALAKVKGKAK